MTNNFFDFKIRDKLKKMPEYKFLRKEYSFTPQILSDKGRKVTLDMVIDMIVYSSRGDKELAIRGLRTSKDFVERCSDFLQHHSHFPRHYSFKILIEIWTTGFLATKIFHGLEWDVLDSIPHIILERVLDEMEELLWFQVRVLWIQERIEQYKEENETLNRALK